MKELFIKKKEKHQLIIGNKKTIMITICFLVFTFESFSQDIIITKNSERIDAKVIEVNVDTIKYKRFENLEGPIYSLLKSNIVTIVYQNGYVEIFSNESSPVSKAAPASSTQMIPYKNFNLKQMMSINAPHLYDRYNSANNLSNIGTGLTLAGLGAAIFGYTIADKETRSSSMGTEVYLSGPGAAIFSAGFIGACVGTPLWIVGAVKKKRVRNAYLREFGYSNYVPTQSSPYLQITTAQKGMGIGMAFVF